MYKSTDCKLYNNHDYVPKDILICMWVDSLNIGLLKEYIIQRAHTIYSQVC